MKLWNQFVSIDIRFIHDKCQKSLLNEIVPTISSDLKELYQQVNTLSLPNNVNSYFWTMTRVNNIIRDDHSHIKITNINALNDILFTGFVLDLIIHEGQPKIVVVKSFVDSVHRGDEITSINKENSIEFLLRLSQQYMKSSGSLYSRMKGVGIYLCLYNPFEPITSIQISGSKHMKVSYMKAVKGLFPQNQGLMTYLRSVTLKCDMNQKDIDARFLKQSKLAYYDIHKFITHDENLMKVSSLIQQIPNTNQEWIVLDMRNNGGGSLFLTLIFGQYLFSPQIVKQYIECQTQMFDLNNEFLERYNEQYILPVLNDPNVQTHVKRQFKQMQTQLMAQKQRLFNVNGSDSKYCKKPRVPPYSLKLANDIVKDLYYKKIITVVNRHCYSACVHTHAFMHMFPNVISLGESVGITTGSGNSIEFQLPSTQASVYIPQLLTDNQIKQVHDSYSKYNNVDIMLDSSQVEDKDGPLMYILEHKADILKAFKRKAKKILKKHK